MVGVIFSIAGKKPDELGGGISRVATGIEALIIKTIFEYRRKCA